MSTWTRLAETQKLSLPERIEPYERAGWIDFAKRLADLHRHEDGLLNTRLQAYIVTTALLMAAVSQFRDERFLPIATAICLSGLFLSGGAFRVLSRTARTIEWYLDVLARLDPLLFSQKSQRLYEARQELLGELKEGKKAYGYPVSAVVGVWLPSLVALTWFLVVVALWWVHRAWVLQQIIER